MAFQCARLTAQVASPRVQKWSVQSGFGTRTWNAERLGDKYLSSTWVHLLVFAAAAPIRAARSMALSNSWYHSAWARLGGVDTAYDVL